MNRINNLAGTKITVYHTFHDEVNHCRQHVWRCTGECRTWKPFMGFVKRSMNRAPGPHDLWWADHSRKCSGTFEKIAEPEGFKTKQIKRKSDDSINEASQTSSQINKKKVRPDDKSLMKIDNYFQTSQKKQLSATASSSQYSNEENEDILIIDEIKAANKNDVFVIDKIIPTQSNKTIDCPICFSILPQDQIEDHVNSHFD